MMSIKSKFKKWLANQLKDELKEYISIDFPVLPPVRVYEKEFQILRAEIEYSDSDLYNEHRIKRAKQELSESALEYISIVKIEDGRYKRLELELVVMQKKRTYDNNKRSNKTDKSL